jgi:hypothetical protein
MGTSKQPDSGPGRAADPSHLPTPEDPREHEPMRDPPIYPEHDDVGVEEIRQAHRDRGVEAPDPSPDSIVSDGAAD